jgi:hypothetical protein
LLLLIGLLVKVVGKGLRLQLGLVCCSLLLLSREAVAFRVLELVAHLRLLFGWWALGPWLAHLALSH